MRVLLLLCLLACAGCSQPSLLTRQDYQKSQQEFIRGDDDDALLDFPRGREDGDFITTMEKGYLSLIQGKPQIAGLQEQARLQENQVRYRVSREARTFFYVRTPEDYYPSEHEVIWLHLLLGWGYAQQGKYTDACVEARVAGTLLTLPWSPAGHFDDPTLRVFLASLWTMCGDWREAQVDLRDAWAMDNGLGWVRDLAARDRPPAQLFVVLGGPGPDVEWDPEFKANPLRSERRVKFVLRGRKSHLSIGDARGLLIDTHLTPDAGPWYARHLERESELDELIQDSAYGGRAAASGAKATAIFAGQTAQGILTGIVSGALLGAGALAYADVKGGNAGSTSGSATTFSASDYRTAAAIGGVVGGLIGGFVGAMEGYDKGTAEMKEDLDPAPYYRYVRYLPEYLWVGWTDQAVTYPVRMATPWQSVEFRQPGVVNGSAVTIAHVADGRQTACTYRDDRVASTITTPPDGLGNCPPEPPF
jgi:hypothetical protein